MIANIKSHMISDDFFTLPNEYVPQDRNNFSIGFSFDIGPENENTSNVFDIHISNECNQSNIIYSVDDVIFSKGCIQMNYYDYSKALEVINKYIKTINFHSWDEIAQELSKVFNWEFEDYYKV